MISLSRKGTVWDDDWRIEWCHCQMIVQDGSHRHRGASLIDTPFVKAVMKNCASVFNVHTFVGSEGFLKRSLKRKWYQSSDGASCVSDHHHYYLWNQYELITNLANFSVYFILLFYLFYLYIKFWKVFFS